MAKNPVLPLYYNDLTTSTQDWTDEEFGAYVRLLIHQWRQGGLPKDYQRLTRISTSLATNWKMLQSKFPESDGLLKNPYMEEVRAKKAKHSEKQRDNVNNRYQNTYQNSTKQPTKILPLEEEKEIEKEIEELLKGLDEIYISNQRSKWKEIDFDFELVAFCEKVRGSPKKYIGHEVEGIRLAFQSQLRNAKKNVNRSTTQGTTAGAVTRFSGTGYSKKL